MQSYVVIIQPSDKASPDWYTIVSKQFLDSISKTDVSKVSVSELHVTCDRYQNMLIGMINWKGDAIPTFWGLQMEAFGKKNTWYWYPYEEPSEEEHESYGPDYNFGDLDW
jgi:hypothetical protein